MDRQRVYSALVFFPCFYALVRYLPPAAFYAFVAVGILLAQYEYYRLYFSERWSPPIGIGLALGLLVTAGFAMPGWLSDQLTVSFAIGAILLSQLLSGRELKSSLVDVAVIAFGVFYVAWLLGHLIPLRSFPDGPFLIFFLFLVTWAHDTGAFYVGYNWGRRPLAPRISPRKTWEGLAGGVVASILVAYGCRAWFLPTWTIAETFWTGALIGIVAPLGDLCESILKRSAGVKDSGGLIPGHGGVLDRADSLIFTAPAFYYYLLATRTP